MLSVHNLLIVVESFQGLEDDAKYIVINHF